MTSREFLLSIWQWTLTRRSLLLRTDSCYVPSPWLLSPNFLLCSWSKHNSVLWLLNFLVTAPSTGELLYRVWTTTTSYEGPDGRHAGGRNALRDLRKLSGWMIYKKNVLLPAYSSVQYVDSMGRTERRRQCTSCWCFLIFYCSAVFLTHAPM
jgi:hypothetical protein